MFIFKYCFKGDVIIPGIHKVPVLKALFKFHVIAQEIYKQFR